jgi:hypothetical protein
LQYGESGDLTFEGDVVPGDSTAAVEEDAKTEGIDSGVRFANAREIGLDDEGNGIEFGLEVGFRLKRA